MQQDTEINPVMFDEEAERRNFYLEEGYLHEASQVAKKLGIHCKVAVTHPFFNHFYPYAEDATKGLSWEEILYEVLKVFKKEFSNSSRNYGEFAVVAKTYVKEVVSHDQIKTFTDGKPRDKRVVVMVTWMPDDKKNPSLVLGIKEHQWL